MGLRNKRGSFTIFAVLIFSSVLIMVGAVLWASGQYAVSSAGEDLGRLWGRSILAEYDRNLKERYGLFGFYGNEVLVEEKLNFYADGTFGTKDYIDYDGASCSLEGWSLTNPEIFKKQVGETILSGTVPRPVTKTTPETETASGPRKITTRWIIQGLPSKGQSGGVSVVSLIEKLKENKTITAVIDNTAMNTYIFRFFRDRLNGRELGETYLYNEIEYILTGVPDDEKSQKSVENTLVILRNGLNLAYLYTSESKSGAALSAAEIITPGPTALVTQALILETWAYMEARNDLAILCSGQSVAVFKDDLNWALSLENVLASIFGEGDEGSNVSEDRYIAPPDMSGAEYEDYLRILLNALPENIKILRVMDLIQINMKYLCYDWFLLGDYYGGLEFSLEVNGKKHEFKEEY